MQLQTHREWERDIGNTMHSGALGHQHSSRDWVIVEVDVKMYIIHIRIENAFWVLNCHICCHDRSGNGSEMKRNFQFFSLETTHWWQWTNSSMKINNLSSSFVFIIYYRFIISKPLEFVSAHVMNNLRKQDWKCYVAQLRSLSVFIKQCFDSLFSNSWSEIMHLFHLSPVKLFWVSFQSCIRVILLFYPLMF